MEKNLFRTLLTFIVILAAILAFSAKAEAAGGTTTLMIYVIGSDLESANPDSPAATIDMEEMKSIKSTKNLNIVLQTGGSSQWYTEGISNRNNQRWKIANGEMTLIEDLGPKNMGQSSTLSDFISWGMSNYNSERYVLILWDHGSGSIYGYGADELNEWDSLTLNELQSAFSTAYANTGEKLDLVGFDACLMQCLETSAILAPYADYMVASEETEPDNGWDYANIVDTLSKQPGISNQDLGKTIVDSYKRQCQKLETGEYITLSVVDLSKIGAVETSIDNLAKSLSPMLKDQAKVADIAKARLAAESYGQDSDPNSCMDMVDIWCLADKLSAISPQASKNLKNAVDNAVVYSINSTGKPFAKGLSVYFPAEARDYFADRSGIYSSMPVTSNYQQFVEDYSQVLLNDTSGVVTDATPEISEATDTGTANDEYYEISVPPEDLQNIAEVQSVLGVYLEDAVEGENGTNIILYIGLDNDVEIDYEKSVLRSYVAHAWDMMDGQVVAMYYMESGEDFAEYYMPAYLNGKDVDIIVIYSDEYPNGHVLGAKPVDEMPADTVPKGFITIGKGDHVIPVYFYENVDDETDYGWIQGDEFAVNTSELEVDYDILPTGKYLYGFLLKDYAGNVTATDFVAVYHNEDEWYIPDDTDSNDQSDENTDHWTDTSDSEGIQVYLNDNLMTFDIEPQMVNGRVMVPMRAILEALGATVEWNDVTQTATVQSGSIFMILPVGIPQAVVNGQTISLDAATMLYDDRVLVPLRFVSEVLNAKVDWNEATQTVEITTY